MESTRTADTIYLIILFMGVSTGRVDGAMALPIILLSP